MGYFRTKHLAVSWGYDIETDSPFSFRMALGHRDCEPDTIIHRPIRYRLLFGFWFDWPKLIWAHETWAVDEPGYLRGMPVRRPRPLRRLWPGQKWHLRGLSWCRGWSFNRYD
jgi:hypothetical protein